LAEAHRISGGKLVHLAGTTILLLPGGCSLPQSVFEQAGTDSREISTLFFIMAAGAGIIWLAVMATAAAAATDIVKPPSGRTINLFIIIAGILTPTVVLAVLLVFGLSLLPSWSEDPGRLKVHVHGEQWWWRVDYQEPGGRHAVSANEIHLPAGQAVEFVLTSADVIHSFWIPAIGGKMDMIPGRETRLLLKAEKPGIYRGVCAEYCGTSHALMAFSVVVHEQESFDSWLTETGRPAAVDGNSRGADLFLSSGCGACHRIEGIAELGDVGPDLTHIGARRTIAAGIAPNTSENMIRWLTNPGAMKPGAQMPAYHMLPENDLEQIALFLRRLK
jgi:cytochrome c oxidase subunit 2